MAAWRALNLLARLCLITRLPRGRKNDLLLRAGRVFYRGGRNAFCRDKVFCSNHAAVYSLASTHRLSEWRRRGGSGRAVDNG